jgi:spore germination protein YaaH
VGAGATRLGVPVADLTAPASASSSAVPISVITWLYPTDPASFVALQREAHLLSAVCPAWYTIDASLAISSRAQAAVLRFARARGLPVLPLIRTANFDPQVAQAILETPRQRAAVAAKIARLVLDHDYAGINIDFEGHFGAYRNQFSDFMARLATLLHPAGKQLSVDVVPQFAPLAQIPTTSGAAPFDYAALAESCDAVILMAYAHADRKPGSLAPLWWVRDATAFALTQVPPAKLVVGQSFYGRHWIVNGSQITHTDLTQAAAQALLAQTGATLQRSVADATPHFTWQDAQGQHIVHYEDAVSLAAKLRAVLAQGVAGLAFWRLGQEEPSQWPVIAKAVQSAS